jgi:hypothetical protein
MEENEPDSRCPYEALYLESIRGPLSHPPNPDMSRIHRFIGSPAIHVTIQCTLK